MFNGHRKALNFSERNMLFLEKQYGLNAKFCSTINFLISLFILGGSLLSKKIVSCGIILDYVEQRLGEK